MAHNDTIILEWSFSPPEYFETEIRLERDNYEMVIGHGKVEAKISPSIYESNPNMRNELHEALNGRFLGVQLLTHKPYELSDSSMYRLHPDGRKDVTKFLTSAVVRMFGGVVGVIVKDNDGNVVTDSRSERIEKKKSLADLAEKYRSNDPTSKSILSSYKAAVCDPNNELVHLYEIRDALSTTFGNKNTACSALGIPEKKWNRFGSLTCVEPLKQGRHRGNSIGTLRDATEAELTEAREFVRQLIEAYLEHLEQKNASST